MKRYNLTIVIILILAFGGAASYGQGFSNVGSAGGNFLKVPAEPVGAALGNSNVAFVKGAAGLYWNPGAVAFTEGTEILASQVNWIADTRLSFLGVSHNLGFGAIGLSLSAMTMDQMEITTELQPNGTGNFFNAGSYAVGLTYAMKIIDRFSFGVTAKYIYEYIWDTNGSTYLFDFGSVYITDFHNLRIGMRLSNFGGNMTFSGAPIDSKPDVIEESGITYPYDPRLDRIAPEFPMPQLFNVGVSIDPIKTDNGTLTITAAVNDPNDNNTQVVFGGQYEWNDLLFLRLGYKTGYDEQNLSAGVGVKVNIGPISPQFNFAYSSFGKLGYVMFFGINFGM